MIDLSAIESLEIHSPDFQGRKFAIVSNERVDTGDGILKSAMMPLPTLLMGLFGTNATFYISGVSEYDPELGQVTTKTPTEFKAKVYAESYTLQEKASIPELLNGDIKVYVPGEALGYSSVALLILQVRSTGATVSRTLPPGAD
jgi:hypothetical protein